jgi:ADP-ribosylglycohydrolase
MKASHEVLSALHPDLTDRASLDRGGTFPLAHTRNLREGISCCVSFAGFAPLVLKTALYFVENSRDFNSALDPSLNYAGSANYCPVIVGAIAGTKLRTFGETTIPG